MKLEGKVAIVTGAGGAGGIGRACALKFASEGAQIVIADVVDGTKAKEEIIAMGGQAIFVRTDVADEQSTKELAQSSLDQFGRIDILMNNAGVFASLGKKSFMDISTAEWDLVLGVNLRGMFNCAKAVYPQMKKQGKGKIVNVTSSTFFQGVPFFLHYVSSKGGVIAFTRALAREVGDDGIAVNAIAPGLTASDAVAGNPMYPPDYLKTASATRCFKRPEYPEDLTGAALFLASDDSDFMTGQTLNVDGGVIFH